MKSHTTSYVKIIQGRMRKDTKLSYDLVWRKPMKTSYEVVREKLLNYHTTSYVEISIKTACKVVCKVTKLSYDLVWRKPMKTSYVENPWNIMQDMKNGETLTSVWHTTSYVITYELVRATSWFLQTSSYVKPLWFLHTSMIWVHKRVLEMMARHRRLLNLGKGLTVDVLK